MIVVYSSALVAILEEEPEHRQFKAIIEAAPRRIVSSVSVYETGIVLLRRRGPGGVEDVNALIDAFDFEVVAFDRTFSDAALDAYARFGKGIDPEARLNMGDCASYALAKSLDAPLLFKGNDFAVTGIKRCSTGTFIKQVYNRQRLHSAFTYRPPADFKASLPPRWAAAQPPSAAEINPTCQ